MRLGSQSLRGFVCSVGVAKARRVAIKMLQLSLAKNWYSIIVFFCPTWCFCLHLLVIFSSLSNTLSSKTSCLFYENGQKVLWDSFSGMFLICI